MSAEKKKSVAVHSGLGDLSGKRDELMTHNTDFSVFFWIFYSIG